MRNGLSVNISRLALWKLQQMILIEMSQPSNMYQHLKSEKGKEIIKAGGGQWVSKVF